jgi:flagellar hook-associated protein FlgK
MFSVCAGLKAVVIHHERWAINGKIVASDESELAKAEAERSRNELCSFTEEAVQSIPTNAAPKASTRAQREVSFAVTKLFAPGNAAAFPANRLEAINALMVYTEMSAADATTTIDAWTTSYKNLEAELDKVKTEMNNQKALAERTARATADATGDLKAHNISRAARWSFFALLIGLLGASLGGRCGAKCALRKANAQRAP